MHVFQIQYLFIYYTANSRLERLRQSLLSQQRQPLQQQQQKQQLQTLETNVITINTTVASMRIQPNVFESPECTPENMGTMIHSNTISTANDGKLKAILLQKFLSNIIL